MSKKLILLVMCVVISTSGYCIASSHAAGSNLMLSEQELTWLSCKPNDDLEKVVRILNDKHKMNMDSMRDWGVNSFVDGDPHSTMAWIFAVDGNKQNKLSRAQYHRTKESKGGPKLKTSRGIGFRANIVSIYKAYGKNPKITRKKVPGMHFLDLEYPFTLQETGQRGVLKFTLEHKSDVPENKASLITMEWYFDQWHMEQLQRPLPEVQVVK